MSKARFDTTAPTPAMPYGKPAAPVVRSLPMSGLAEGETRVATVYRERTIADVVTPLAWATAIGVLAGIAGVIGWLQFQWSPFVAAWLWFIGTVATLFVCGRDFFDDDKLIVNRQEISREHVVPPPAPVGEPSVFNLTFDERDERGRSTGRQVRAQLVAPRSNPGGMAAYCDALLRGTAYPSIDGQRGKANGARSFGYNEGEFDAWRDEAIRAGLLKSKGAKQGKNITERGQQAFARIAQQGLRAASFGVPDHSPDGGVPRFSTPGRTDGRLTDGGVGEG